VVLREFAQRWQLVPRLEGAVADLAFERIGQRDGNRSAIS